MKLNIPAAWREGVYVATLVLSVALGVLVVSGVATETQIFGVFDIAAKAFAALAGLLALINLTPDAPPDE